MSRDVDGSGLVPLRLVGQGVQGAHRQPAARAARQDTSDPVPQVAASGNGSFWLVLRREKDKPPKTPSS